MIVGIDPGTTIGVAVLDLDGKVLELSSYRNKPLDDVVKSISSYSPAVVASDVKPVPDSVRKVAVAFDATLFSPPEPLSVSEKQQLTRAHKTSNDHERDALAAALKAFQHFSPKIRKAKRIAREKQAEIERAALGRVRIADVVGSATAVKKEEERAEAPKLRKELGIEKRRVRELEGQLSALKQSLSKARSRITQLESRLKRAERKLGEREEQKKRAREEREMERKLSPSEVEELFKSYKKK